MRLSKSGLEDSPEVDLDVGVLPLCSRITLYLLCGTRRFRGYIILSIGNAGNLSHECDHLFVRLTSHNFFHSDTCYAEDRTANAPIRMRR